MPFRHDVANDNDATMNADKAPDFDRDRFRKPLLEIRRARTIPTVVRTMSAAGAVANADEKSGGDECCGMLMTAVNGFEKLDADDTRRTKKSKVQRFMMLRLRSARQREMELSTLLR